MNVKPGQIAYNVHFDMYVIRNSDTVDSLFSDMYTVLCDGKPFRSYPWENKLVKCVNTNQGR